MKIIILCFTKYSSTTDFIFPAFNCAVKVKVYFCVLLEVTDKYTINSTSEDQRIQLEQRLWNIANTLRVK